MYCTKYNVKIYKNVQVHKTSHMNQVHVYMRIQMYILHKYKYVAYLYIFVYIVYMCIVRLDVHVRRLCMCTHWNMRTVQRCIKSLMKWQGGMPFSPRSPLSSLNLPSLFSFVFSLAFERKISTFKVWKDCLHDSKSIPTHREAAALRDACVCPTTHTTKWFVIASLKCQRRFKRSLFLLQLHLFKRCFSRMLWKILFLQKESFFSVKESFYSIPLFCKSKTLHFRDARFWMPIHLSGHGWQASRRNQLR